MKIAESALVGEGRKAREAHDSAFLNLELIEGLDGRRRLMAELKKETPGNESKPLLAVSADSDNDGPPVPLSAIVRGSQLLSVRHSSAVGPHGYAELSWLYGLLDRTSLSLAFHQIGTFPSVSCSSANGASLVA